MRDDPGRRVMEALNNIGNKMAVCGRKGEGEGAKGRGERRGRKEGAKERDEGEIVKLDVKEP